MAQAIVVPNTIAIPLDTPYDAPYGFPLDAGVSEARCFKECGQLNLLHNMMKSLVVIAADADLLCDGMCINFLTAHGHVELCDGDA